MFCWPCISFQFLWITNLTHISFSVYIYSKSLHISSTTVFIIRRINCINMTSGICQIWHLVYVTLCRWPSSVQVWMETCTLDGHLHRVTYTRYYINSLNPELNPICYLLALLGAHHFLHVSRIRVRLLTFRLLMSYIYGAPILDVSRSHTTTQHSR